MVKGTDQAGRTGVWRVHAAWAVCLLVAVAATFWAGRTILRPPTVEEVQSAPAATVTVTEGVVQESQTVSGTATYRPVGRGLSGRSGTLTSISVPEDGLVRQGDVLVTIDLEPVLVAQGEVPMFRDLEVGSRGKDVNQLRAWLGLDASEVFDAETESAVRGWQRGAGLEETGVVQLGQVVFVPSLPAPALVAPDLQVGDSVQPGQVLIEVFAPRPDVHVSAQAGGGVGLAPGLAATVGTEAVGELVWAPSDEQGMPRLAVVDSGGQPACTDECAAEVSAPGPSSVDVVIEVVSPAQGPVLPRAAILFAPDGTAQVQRDSGDLVPVTVVREARGQAVVDGVEVGDVVRLFPDSP